MLTQGSKYGALMAHSKFFSAGQPLPVSLCLNLDAPVTGGTAVAREQLNRPTVLIHSPDPAFASSWFSQGMDLGDSGAEPAYWMLQKAGKARWSLCLRRSSGDIVKYDLTTQKKSFPIKLKNGRVAHKFQWPRSVTIRQGTQVS
jgi:hypothetical protein